MDCGYEAVITQDFGDYVAKKPILEHLDMQGLPAFCCRTRPFSLHFIFLVTRTFSSPVRKLQDESDETLTAGLRSLLPQVGCGTHEYVVQ